jgi:hypothetical protein
MAERHWKRVKQSGLIFYGDELPARVVIEHDEADHSFRIFLRLSRLTASCASRRHAFTIGWRMR